MVLPIPVKHINLALQGGGAHGAFTWGVLDRLLEDPRIAIVGVSATSSGAMNAAVLAAGLTVGGPDGAREALDKFWRHVAQPTTFWAPLQASWFEAVSLFFSPYQLNPLDYNPLRQYIERTLDFEMLRERSAVKLFLCATNVRTGKVKVFTDKEITPDCVLASACLPHLFKAVEIDGEYYWDGGYMGNPPLFPLIYSCDSRDILVVHINPMERPEIPTTTREITNRVNEISFNSSLMREMRAVAFVTDLIDAGKLGQEDAKRMLVHSICADGTMKDLNSSTKLNVDQAFLLGLRSLGRKQAGAWLDNNFDDLGIRSTLDIRATYL
jgi:NTE family protein